MPARRAQLRSTLPGVFLLGCLSFGAEPLAQPPVPDNPAAEAADPAPLTEDPRWVRGALPNGVRYIVRTHDAVDGRLVLKLWAEAGSLHEGTNELGSSFLTAMLLHAAAMESPVGKAVLSLGEDLPAGVRAAAADASQDAAQFTVTLPLASDKAIVLGLRHLRGIAEGAGLDEDSIMKHRPFVRSQRAAMISRKDRLLSAVMPQIAPGSKAASHPAIPSDAAMCALEGDALRAFQTESYAPSRLTIVAVGDTSTQSLVEHIRREFGGLPPRAPFEQEAPPPPPARTPELRAAVAADPELPLAIAEVVVVHEGSSSIRTRAAWRASIVERIASSVLQRRLLASMDQPGSPVRGGGVRIGPAPGGAVVAVASVMGDASDWNRLVAAVASGVSRACTETPTPDELDAARQGVLRTLTDAAASEASDDPAALVDAATLSALSGDTLVAHADEATLAAEVLPGIEPNEVQESLAARFRLRDATFILFMPDRAGTPPPVDILAAALPSILPQSSRANAPTTLRDTSDAQSAALPPGRIASIKLNPSLAVTTARLENGIQFLHRRMSGPEPRVSIAVALRRPDATPDAAQPPVEATSALWSSPASRSVSADQMRQIMAAGRIDFRFHAGPGMARLELSCPVSSASEALRLVHLLLSEPRVDAAAFERWRWSMAQRARANTADPTTAAFDAVCATFREAGLQSAWNPTEEELERLTPESVQTWIERIVTLGTVDTAMVGDIARDDALDLAMTFLASLPGRAPPAPTRKDEAAPMPRFAEHRIETRGPASDAIVLLAINGAPAASDDEAVLDLAARILTSRLNPRAGIEAPATKPIAVKHLPSYIIGGAPILLAIGATSPNLITSLSERMGRAITSLATDGPTDSELTKARADAVEDFDRRRNDPAWWARTLSQADAIGTNINGLIDERGTLIAISRDSVRSALSRHDPAACCGQQRLRIIVTPAEPAAP